MGRHPTNPAPANQPVHKAPTLAPQTTRPDAECILQAKVQNTSYYGTVSSGKLTMTSKGKLASRFKLEPLNRLTSARAKHLAGKYALIWRGKATPTSKVSSWYIADDLSCVAHSKSTFKSLSAASSTAPLPIGVTGTQMECSAVSVTPGKEDAIITVKIPPAVCPSGAPIQVLAATSVFQGAVDSTKKGLSTGAKWGIGAACVVGFALLVAGAYMYKQKQNNKMRYSKMEPMEPIAPMK